MSNPENLINLFGRRALESATSEEYVEWAVEMLTLGYDSRNLAMLAGLIPPYSWFEVQSHFLKALDELGIEQPSTNRAITDYSCQVAQDVIAGRLSASGGVALLYEVACTLGYPRAYRRWVDLDDIRGDIGASRLPNWLASMTPRKFERTVLSEAAEFLQELRGF